FTPYAITFRCFSQDLAKVLSNFASSPNGFIVKGVNVQPAASSAASASPENAPAGYNRYAPMMAQNQPPPVSVGMNGLRTVLNEQLLSVTMDIEIVELVPKK
ncbi:MAG: hypothetical protein ACREC8_04670, partial [Limisphaerales bacterium]